MFYFILFFDFVFFLFFGLYRVGGTPFRIKFARIKVLQSLALWVEVSFFWNVNRKGDNECRP